MGETHNDAGLEIADLLNKIKNQRDWVSEINSLYQLMVELNQLGKAVSVRQVANLTQRSKSWVAVSVILIKGLKVYPEIEKCQTRNEAYTYLLKKQKLRRFLES